MANQPKEIYICPECLTACHCVNPDETDRDYTQCSACFHKAPRMAFGDLFDIDDRHEWAAGDMDALGALNEAAKNA